MAPTDAARTNQEKLFPGHISSLKNTDPEFIEYFDNFAFDEVLRHSRLEPETRFMVQLASLIACQAVQEYRVMLKGALRMGVTPVQVKEIVYQAVPYAGMARVFDFLHVTNEVLTELDVALPLPGQSTTTPETRLEEGLRVQKSIIGADRVEGLYAAAPEDELHIQGFLSDNCFGDTYTRTGVDLRTRELITFALLVSLGGCDPQVKGHVAANVRVGNDRQRLIDVVTQLLPYIGYPRSLNALAAINEITEPPVPEPNRS